MNDILRQTDEKPVRILNGFEFAEELASATQDSPVPAGRQINLLASASSGVQYTVQKGDTLSEIADEYGVTVDDIMAANPQITDPDEIYIGEVITIPTGSSDDIILYTVRKGDTLSGIADEYGVTVDDIMAANPRITDPDEIYLGEVITIPTGSGDESIPYTVRKGDTLSGIAAEYGVTVDDIMAANPQITDPDEIYVGEVITIPTGSGDDDYTYKYLNPSDFPQISPGRLQRIDSSLSKVSSTRLNVVKECLHWAYDDKASPSAKKLMALYIYGMNLYDTNLNVQIATADIINQQAAQYPEYFDDGRKSWMLDQVQQNPNLACSDCSGMEVGYLRKFKLVSNTFDTTADNFCSNSYSSSVSKSDLTPADWVGKSGHIGTYVGGGYVVAFEGGAYGCQLTDIDTRQVRNLMTNQLEELSAWTKYRNPKYY